VHINVVQHEQFAREGDDLVCEMSVGLAQAALGAHLVLPTFEGDEDLVVPAGTQSGREFVLRGRGVPHLNGRGRGHLRVRVVVETPSKLSDAEAEALRAYAAARGEEVAEADAGFFSRIKSAFS
jgi:molecular chaperone DnaJ